MAGRGLMDLTDEEYSKVKTIEGTINDIETGATTGTRGEIRNAIEADKLKTQIEKDEAELKETNEDLDGIGLKKEGVKMKKEKQN